MPTVVVKDLHKTFWGVRALDGMSFEASEGEFFALLGPSGAGKSTTLRIIAGLEHPEAGDVYFGDERMTDVPPRKRDVAMVFQSYALYPHKTVLDNVAMPLIFRKVSRSERARLATIATEKVRIAHLLDRFPGQLSGGEKQRVAIARAIVRKPKAFLMDEPLTNLDAKLRIEMRAEMKKLAKEMGATTIYSTPDQAEALTMADRIAVVREGQIVQTGNGVDLYEHPKNKLVAGTVGSPSMNFVNCTFKELDGKAFLDAGEFSYDITAHAEVIKEHATSSEVILGIRPEHIGVSKAKSSADGISGEIFVIEPARPEAVVDVHVGSLLFRVKVPPSSELVPGDKIWLNFDREKVRVLDRRTEEIIR